MTHFIADFTDGKQLRLFTRRQTIVAHAGLAKLLRHFGKVPGVVINTGSNPHIGQRILRLQGGGVAGGQRPERDARQQQEKGQRWQQTERRTGINRVCASSQKWIEVLVYRFFPAPACGQFE